MDADAGLDERPMPVAVRRCTTSTRSYERVNDMLWTILLVLLLLWVLGFAGGVGGNLIHLILVIAVIVLIVNLVSGRKV